MGPVHSPGTPKVNHETGFAHRRVLLTGANGLIGGALADRLARSGARVRGMVRGEAQARDCPGVEIENGDVTDASAVRRAVAGCNLVIHCAAMQGQEGTLADMRQVNVGGR